jgi:hypothetical protein
MDSLLNSLMQQLNRDDALKQISRQIGADEASTQRAVSAALPVLMGALGRNASKPRGAQSLANALAKDHDGSVLDDVIGFLGRGGNTDDGAGILRHVLGGRQPKVEKKISQASGLDLSQIAQLLPLLAPLIMGLLGRQQRQQGLDLGGLIGVLSGERRQADDMLGGLGGLSGVLGRGGAGDLLSSVLGGWLARPAIDCCLHRIRPPKLVSGAVLVEPARSGYTRLT